jgi:hypothetical protein
MKPIVASAGINRRVLLSTLAALPTLSGTLLPTWAPAQTSSSGSLLPSWNDGPAKQAIFDFVRATIDRSSPSYVFPEDRIAVLQDLEKIILATLSGMTTDEFNAEVKKWLATAKDLRWKRSYTELTYQPMLEVMSYFRANAYKTYIVTGFGQDFVRVYSQQIYGVPPEQVIGSALATKYGYAKDGKPILTKEPKLLLNDNFGGKPESIDLIIGRRPYAAFGNSTGDQQMLEYTGAGDGARLKMLVLHDDASREYAYGPAQGLPDTKVGTFTQALYDEANKSGWTVISMKNDWRRFFAFE